MNAAKLKQSRYSLVHILTAAVLEIYPEAKFTFGSTTETGFYCDFDTTGIDDKGKRISLSDLKKINFEMEKIIKAGVPIITKKIGLKEAIDWCDGNGQIYKSEALKELKQANRLVTTTSIDPNLIGLEADDSVKRFRKVIFCQLGRLEDISCRDGVKNTNQVGVFKLTKLAGAYWKGDEEQKQLQRITGIAFADQEGLDQFQKKTEKIKSNDHRILGKKHGLYMQSDIVGAGCPTWLEDGATIRRQIERMVVDEEIARGYRHVCTPDIATLDLYKQSGHYPYYKEDMYPPMAVDDQKFILRAMSCPHHYQIYNRKPRSYRQLPFRIGEMVKLYRFEKSGELVGLNRVRTYTLSDGHIICRLDQAEEEIGAALDLIDHFAGIFGMKFGKHYWYRLSLGDRSNTKKYYKDDEAWDFAENCFRNFLKKRGRKFIEAKDEAAFYGPKIDIQVNYATGEDSLWTIQYDFMAPKRFNISYVDQDGKNNTSTVVIHRSAIGCLERFFAYLIELYKARFPIWLCPNQLNIATVHDKPEVISLVDKIVKKARSLNLRVRVDQSNNSISKKIRQASIDLRPCTLVIGDEEVKSGLIEPRWRSDLIPSNFASKKIKWEDILRIISISDKKRSLKVVLPKSLLKK